MRFNWVIGALCVLWSHTLLAACSVRDPMTPADLQGRLRPITVATVSVDTSAPVSQDLAALPTGERVYKKACFVCHATGVAGAPKLGDKAAWEPRAAKGMDVMLQTVIKGLNAMPPRGTCMDCTDDELKEAIQYMLDQ